MRATGGRKTRVRVRALGIVFGFVAVASTVIPDLAHAQPTAYNVRVVDQNGLTLAGSLVRVEGVTADVTTPGTITLDPGPHLFVIQPALQGAAFPGGSLMPAGPTNGLSRNEFIFADPMGSDIVIEWRTATLDPGVTDQNGVAIPGARWSLTGEAGSFGPGAVVFPITDNSVYPTLGGPSENGWRFTLQAAFDGVPVDLLRPAAQEVSVTTVALSFEWRQLTCNMGVVDATGGAIRGATWTILGHTFAAGDAITLPVTDESLYAGLAGSLSAGFPILLAANTASGTGAGTFEVMADGSLAPPFVNVNGVLFGLRCGVSPFPPTGSLTGTVTTGSDPFADASLDVLDANGVHHPAQTDAAGSFSVSDLPEGATTVTLTIPTGFHAVEPADGVLAVTIVAGATTPVSFTIAPNAPEPPPVNDPEGSQYWRHEVRAAVRGNGHHEEAFADMAVTFPEAIFADFAQHPTDPVRVEGVTQVDPDGPAGPAPARRLELADMEQTLEASNGDPLAASRRELLAILLNVVSHRLSLNLVVDDQGTTLAQEIRRLAALINDGSAANDLEAKIRAERINGVRAAARSGGNRNHVESTLASGVTLAASPNPVGLSTQLTFNLPEPALVRLSIHDARGRQVGLLVQGEVAAGATSLVWRRGSVEPGIYFARLVWGDSVQTTKLMVAP
jgi:hypothetical protein